jgi:hypothetical protein
MLIAARSVMGLGAAASEPGTLSMILSLRIDQLCLGGVRLFELFWMTASNFRVIRISSALLNSFH